MSDLSIIESYDDSETYQGVQMSVIDGQIQFSDNLEALRQKLRNNLSIWLKTWFLNINYGVNYNIAFQTPYPDNIIPEIQNIITNTIGVSSIQSFIFNKVQGVISIQISILALGKPINLDINTQL